MGRVNPNEIFIYFSNIENEDINIEEIYKSSVHEHAHCRQTRKFCAHEIKWFYSILFKDKD